METTGYLTPRDDDDRGFLLLADRLLDAIEGPFEVLHVVRIRGWFDDKWLRFSELGRVPFRCFRASHPGVALDAFFQDKLTFPAFTPRRILEEAQYGDLELPPTPSIHHPRLRRSSTNLQRRVEAYETSLLAVWISSGSELSGHASFMAYSRSVDGETDAWYASFRRHPTEWRLDRVKGVGRSVVVRWIGEDAPTSVVFARAEAG